MKHVSRPLMLGAAFLVMAAVVPAAFAATPNDQLVIGTSLAQVLSLDPQQGTEVKTQEILANTYDRLVAFDPETSELFGQLAESWDVDDTGITFHLRDAKFASGNPVTAADAVFSLVRLFKMDQSAAAGLKTFGYNSDNAETLITAVDEKTLRVDFADKVIPEALLYRLANGVGSVVDSVEVQKHVVNNDYGNEWLRTNTAGSGPFVLNRWSPNEIVLLERNPNFWGAEPAMTRVMFRHVPESQAARLMMERGDIDIANALTAPDVRYFQAQDGFAIDQAKTGGFYALAMNAGREPLNDPKVREIIAAYGIDYAGIAETIVGPYGRVRNVPAPEDWENAIPNPDWSFRPEEAKEMLAEAGYPDGFSLTIKTIAQPPRVDMATAIQANLAEIGITANVIQGNGSDIVSQHRARDFDLLIPQTSAADPTALGSLDNFTNNPDNSAEANNAGNFVWRSDWDIPELNALRVEANSELDPAKRGELVKQLQEDFIASNPAVFPMFERFEPVVVNVRVDGYDAHPWGLTRLEDVSKGDAN
ncbi:ABC transporter substrate-binding protein [Devosia sp. RR2S18]|uniref:ABC transporter substrate-binding protein n=1 Tax=Devosia rhizosphaerae TaxID=3049774 RepID=UPI002541F2C6|nr:ABC transporter substrate-binding protein [Devosia sp. RR2S18]WIJ26421.1 ABC transporter substrate-binding protein [Devosia sp. RR2S18]